MTGETERKKDWNMEINEGRGMEMMDRRGKGGRRDC